MSPSQQTVSEVRTMKGRDFLKISDFSGEELLKIIDLAAELKAGLGNPEPLKGKILGMIFEKNSTRTRVSFEAGMLQLGGHAIYMNSNDLQLGRGEPVSDTAKVLSQYVNAIMIRTHAHSRVEELAANASIPVINGLTDIAHPCQAIADILTLKEKCGSLQGLKVAYVGDGNNVANSLMAICAKLGIHFAIAAPAEYSPDQSFTEICRQEAKLSGSTVLVTEDPLEAVAGADAVYADVWTSMGQEAENEKRLADFKDYQINAELVRHAKPDYIFLHCLPAHRGEEVTAEVIDGEHSAVFEQAANRMHAQKAMLIELLKD